MNLGALLNNGLVRTFAERVGQAAAVAAGTWLVNHGLLANDNLQNFEGSVLCLAGLAFAAWSSAHTANTKAVVNAVVPQVAAATPDNTAAMDAADAKLKAAGLKGLY